MSSEAQGSCAHVCDGQPVVTELEQLMLAFFDCDITPGVFGEKEARKLRAAMRHDPKAAWKFFDYMIQDRLPAKLHDG